MWQTQVVLAILLSAARFLGWTAKFLGCTSLCLQKLSCRVGRTPTLKYAPKSRHRLAVCRLLRQHGRRPFWLAILLLNNDSVSK